MLKLKYNVIQSPMAGISTPALAAAVARNGGMGSMAMAVHDLTKTQGVESMKADIVKFQSLVPFDMNRNVNINFFCHDKREQSNPPTETQISNWKELLQNGFKNEDLSEVEFSKINISFKEIEQDYPTQYNQVIDILLIYKPKVVSFHFGIPLVKTIETLKSHGISVFVSITSLQDAKSAVVDGVDGLVCQGYEAGGHRGLFTGYSFDEKLSTRALSKLVVKEFPDHFIVAAGGIMDSKDVKELLELGVLGVQLGTAFIDTTETLSKGYASKQAAKDTDTPTTMVPFISGKLARTIRTPFIQAIEEKYQGQDLPPYGYTYSAYKSLLAKTKNPDYGFHLVGQGYRFMKGYGKSAEEVFKDLVKDYDH